MINEKVKKPPHRSLVTFSDLLLPSEVFDAELFRAWRGKEGWRERARIATCLAFDSALVGDLEVACHSLIQPRHS
jgi:hypothetical protein